MKILRLTLLLMLLSAPAFCQTADSLFVLQYSVGENWDFEKPAEEQPFFSTHSRTMSDLRKNSQTLLGGFYSDKGFMIVKAQSEKFLWELLKADLTLSNGVFRAEIFPFDVFYKGCIE